MLRSLSRRGSSLFGSQYLRLQTDPRDLRATEEFLRKCSYSDFSSIAPSVNWQNRLNSLRQALLRLFRLPNSLLARLLITFVIFWLTASAIIRPIERSHQVKSKDEETKRGYALRLQFLQKFGRMDYYIPMSNPEWEESTRYLLSRYENHLINMTSTNWTLPYAFAFAFLAGAGSVVPGTTQVRLSSASKIFLVVWFPLAICLHCLSVLAIIICVRKLRTFWRYLLMWIVTTAWIVYRSTRSMNNLPAAMFHNFIRSILVVFIILELLNYRNRIHRKILVRWSIEQFCGSYSEHDRQRLIADYGRISLWNRWETKFLIPDDYRKIDFVLREIQKTGE